MCSGDLHVERSRHGVRGPALYLYLQPFNNVFQWPKECKFIQRTDLNCHVLMSFSIYSQGKSKLILPAISYFPHISDTISG